MLVRTGGGALTVKLAAPDTPPPGEGFVTVTCAVAFAAMEAARRTAVNCVVLTYVVASELPFHRTVDADMKPVP
jgi:hypothetical protein